MFAATSPSDPIATPTPATPTAMQRSRGTIRLGFKADGDACRLDTLFQQGCGKVRLPKPVSGAAEAVLLNTAGGLTGGDTYAVSVALGAGARAEVAGQAFEKVYKASAGTAEITTELTIGDGARLDWLPQPAILFDRSALRRRTTVRLSGTATFLAVEGLVFGRAAMGETVSRAAIHDGWRVWRDGRLVFADAFCVNAERDEHSIRDTLAGRSTLDGAHATATVLYSGPEAGDALTSIRDLIADASGPAGASLVNDLVVVRLVAPTAQALVADLTRILTFLRGRPMPRVWHC